MHLLTFNNDILYRMIRFSTKPDLFLTVVLRKNFCFSFIKTVRKNVKKKNKCLPRITLTIYCIFNVPMEFVKMQFF